MTPISTNAVNYILFFSYIDLHLSVRHLSKQVHFNDKLTLTMALALIPVVSSSEKKYPNR